MQHEIAEVEADPIRPGVGLLQLPHSLPKFCGDCGEVAPGGGAVDGEGEAAPGAGEGREEAGG